MNLYDLAVCIDNNDNHMTAKTDDDATRATNKLYALQKSCDCPFSLYFYCCLEEYD